ncbi:MAG: nitroreductase family protein [archaeon]
MNVVECIKSRRSVRDYSVKEVSSEIVSELIDCARHAPFGGPSDKKVCQPWEFIIIRNHETKAKLALSFDDRQFVASAPVIIAVLADTKRDPDYKVWESTTSLAIENILLSAHSLGLGACYVSTFMKHEKHKQDKEVLRSALNLPEQVELVALITLGFPKENAEIKQKNLRSLEEIIHDEKW